MTYCTIVWAATYKTSLQKLLSLQKKVLKISLGWFYHSRKNRILQEKTPPTNLTVFQLTNKLRVSDLYKHQSAKFVYLVVNNLSTSCFQHFFKYTSMIQRHNTRQNSNLHLNQSTTSARNFTIVCQGQKIWNTIPLNIQKFPSIYSFAWQYKIFLTANLNN